MNRPITLTGPVMGTQENDCGPAFSVSANPGGLLEEDCAPADGPSKGFTSGYIRQLYAGRPVQVVSQLYTAPLPHQFTLAFSPFTPAGPVVLNPAALNRLQEFNVPQFLDQAVDYTLAACGLLSPVGQEPKLNWDRPATLAAWLHLTNACNLACPYCYIRKSNERMSDEIGRKSIETIFQVARENNFQTVKLKYAGGEAALHFGLLQRMHAYARALAGETGLALKSVVLSNGTLWKPEMARWLVQAGVKLMISLDGVGAAHDRQRPTRAGRGSFAQLERILDQVLMPAGVRPDISITVTGRNADAVADAVAWTLRRGLSFSLNFYREHLLSASYEDLRLEENRIIEGLRQAYRVVEDHLPAYPFLNGLLDRVQAQAHRHTCGVGQSYLVFSHTGHLAQCQMEMDHPLPAGQPENALRSIAHGMIPVLSVDDKAGCRNCMWRYRCAGGCPLETYRATGRFDVQSPHCHIYTTLFPEALRLEGLRLLKLQGYIP